ncbi:uncharacterized protein LOC116215649 [Punica granatum]|uniref:Uncharacterized protein LOC116215649 n=2 Tax=Punica granatum TaxID=22663 RepID=A0A6P8EMZ4_PUNGR|nr:uncharacterized protein LOC116215649 [Punica granatum]PKI48512.1 hypothetical protein CRG98_031134 [Punica granatum]
MLSMASCGLGASNIKISSFNFRGVRIRYTSKWDSRRTLIVPNAPKYAGLVAFRQSDKLRTVCCATSNSETLATADEIVLDGSLEGENSSSTSQLVPNRAEVESLVADICDTASIAEFELKLDGFRLYVLREVNREQTVTPPPPPPVYAESTPSNTNTNDSISSSSLAISKLQLSPDGSSTLLDKAADEGLVILQSPRVGFFRRSRTIKGKRAPPACKEKQIAKEGQVLCYIEQLGGEIPIESDVSGEIVKILREDGDPVGYGDALISILPSFPGIKKLQ